ncbi:hypothetical protein CCM_09137 [Cordyceps militaris CM01]|uniref:Aminoglycoside phosphotransferase domain-containing protein n=1 Tax=Cordyceps militaris (strain CM01) TaxID=983644 RepID=G3JTJ7_CORMM|nr:uncharacterized protein CCM_09137 [Cordyceps militaris CM01]EGX88001.1 hypothetical protein CCM_09137 [Cordyceps militaris CM01]
MKFVRGNTSIPIPEVFHYCTDKSNDVGVPYILMSKASGIALAAHDWQAQRLSSPQHTLQTQPRKTMHHDDRMKVMQQLGYYSSQLYQLRFPSIGSLFEGADGAFGIQQCCSPGHLFEGRDSIQEITRGPFTSSREFYTSLVAALQLHAEQLSMGHHLFMAPIPVPQEYTNISDYLLATDSWNDFAILGGKVESSENRLQYSITGHFLRDAIIPLLTGEREEQGAGFPLCHPDLSDQNIFIDEEFNITCIIDWAFSFTVPPAQLCTAPGLPHPRDVVTDPRLHDAYRDGFSYDANADRDSFSHDAHTCVQSNPLPRDWNTGAAISRFLRIVYMDSLQDYHHLEALCALCFDGKPFDLPSILSRQALTPDAINLRELLAADDDPQELTRRRDTEYFQAVGPTRLAVARKLTLAYERNARFVADYRLWKWVGAVYRSSLESCVREDCYRLESRLRGRTTRQVELAA